MRVIKTLTATFLAFGAAFALASDSEPIVKTVMSEGIGKTIEEAIQNGTKNALVNVAGSFMDAETIIQNRTKIEDGLREESKKVNRDIKEYSQGTVKSVDVLDGKCDDGLCRATLKVTVRLEDFKLYLKKFSVARSEVSQGLFAEFKQQESQEKNSRELILKNVINPVVDRTAFDLSIGKPMTAESGIEDVLAWVPNTVMAIKPDWARSLMEELVQDAKKANPESFIFVLPAQARFKEGYLDNAKKTLEAVASQKEVKYPEIQRKNMLLVQWMEGSDAANFRASPMNIYYLIKDNPYSAERQQGDEKGPQLTLSFLDAAGNVLQKQRFASSKAGHFSIFFPYQKGSEGFGRGDPTRFTPSVGIWGPEFVLPLMERRFWIVASLPKSQLEAVKSMTLTFE